MDSLGSNAIMLFKIVGILMCLLASSKAIDHCLTNPCFFGTCSSSLQGFICTCDRGYVGTTCATAIDHCLTNPCIHGTCHSSNQGFICSCDRGYVGTTCDTAIDHCLTNPCMHGTCHSSSQGFSCTCDRGYVGTTCNTATYPCTDKYGTYYCTVQNTRACDDPVTALITCSKTCNLCDTWI